ncbi:MAG: hypothetical protein EZS28_033048, partial [Streblomastix strix]
TLMTKMEALILCQKFPNPTKVATSPTNEWKNAIGSGMEVINKRSTK